MLVSVIIPAFNAAPFLPATLASVAEQQVDQLEVVIVNDSSSDNTREVVSRLTAQYDSQVEIRYAEHDVNRGGGATRNTCLELARGEYIFNLDADNLLTPNLLARLLDLSERRRRETGHVAMVSPETLQYFRDVPRKVFGATLPVGRRMQLLHAWRYARLDYEGVLTTAQTPASSGNYLYHRSIADDVGGHFEDCGAYDAWSFGIRCYEAGYRYVLATGTSYLHRLHDHSYWTRNENNGANRTYLLTALRHFPDVYSPSTFALLDPGNPAYPADPFDMLELDAAHKPRVEPTEHMTLRDAAT